MPTCPDGHLSQATDFCDQCGLPIPAGQSPEADDTGMTGPADTAPAAVCPNCGAPRPAGALFCESCGYDYTTGALPEQDLHTALGLGDPPAGESAQPGPQPGTDPGDDSGSTGPADQVDQVSQTVTPPGPPGSTRRSPSVAEIWVDPQWYAAQESTDPLPAQTPPRIVVLRDSALIGRASVSRQITPDIDCEPDAGVSRRQAYLTSADGHWYINDLDSANGTFVAPATAPLPTDPITARTEVTPATRVYVGAWTRIVVRPALPADLPVKVAADTADPNATVPAASPAAPASSGPSQSPQQGE